MPEELRDEIAPKNIIMIGPTGVGKTEVARRLAKLAQAPFVKVEASKFTEVGYVGRDVESIIRDLTELSINLVTEEEKRAVQARAEERAEERVLDALLPPPHRPRDSQTAPEGGETREKLRRLLRQGALDERELEVELADSGGMPQLSIFTPQGVEEMGVQFKDLLGGLMPKKTRRRRMKVPAAREAFAAEEAARLVDADRVRELAVERVEQSGIVFIDEIDKIASASGREARARRVARGRAARPAAHRRGLHGADEARARAHGPRALHRGRRLPRGEAVRPDSRAAGPLPDPGRALEPLGGGLRPHPHRAAKLAGAPVRRAAGDRGRGPRVPGRRRADHRRDRGRR